MRVLHISHHIGCMRDHAYVYDQLGFTYEFWKFPKNVFAITKDIATVVWSMRKEYFNSFDVIVTSDTAPLSRIFMENISELKPRVIVWICNRFDYSMESDPTFYELIRKMMVHPKITFVASTDFERIWCQHRGITNAMQTITPIGRNPRRLDEKIDCLSAFKAQYTGDPNSKNTYTPGAMAGKVVVSIYSNDNAFFDLKGILESRGVSVFNGGYSHPEDLKESIGLVTFPDAFCKWASFETIQHEVIVFLPSKTYMYTLLRTPGYWFNCPSPYSPPNDMLMSMCEFYRYEKCRIYFDSLDDLVLKITMLTPETIAEKKAFCRQYGEEIASDRLLKWKTVFDQSG